MLTKEAIHELSQANAIGAANKPYGDTLALPRDFVLHDMERFAMCRRRVRGTMTTSSVDDFSHYVIHQADDEGSAVFVNEQSFGATAVLNMGSLENPGHCDHLALLVTKHTAAYAALLAVADGTPLKQSAVAEFIEDWADRITAFSGEDTMSTGRAIAAIRRITVEGVRKIEATEQALSATKSTFESVHASSGGDAIPELLGFICEPLHGFTSRNFSIRLGVLTISDKPVLTLRIVNKEQHEEDIALELVAKVKESIQQNATEVGNAIPVLLGTYKPAA